MTDTPTGRELVEKTFTYVATLGKECRKSVSTVFGQKYKGLSFNEVPATLRKEVESWFMERDKNLRITHEKTSSGRMGEVILAYSGSSKDARFKFQINGTFTLNGSSSDAPSYLKNLNVYVDKRDFSKYP